MASSSSAPTPRSPVLVIDATASTPRSARIELSREARGRGWKVVELRAGDDYPEIDAVAAECAADVVAFAGADDSQSKATVVASGRELAYACVPSGVDDLFARDLGIDPDDRLRALVAIEDYCEYYVDLAEVNGRTFVNYAALGLHCSKVRPSAPRERDAWAFSSLASYTAAWQEPPVPLHWLADSRRESCAALFISNNRRRFESHTVGRRTRLDGGVLGIGVLRSGHGDSSVLDRGGSWLELGRAHFEVDSTVPLTVEVDGDPVLLDPPIRFRILPRALRVRIPPAR